MSPMKIMPGMAQGACAVAADAAVILRDCPLLTAVAGHAPSQHIFFGLAICSDQRLLVLSSES